MESVGRSVTRSKNTAAIHWIADCMAMPQFTVNFTETPPDIQYRHIYRNDSNTYRVSTFLYLLSVIRHKAFHLFLFLIV